MSTDFRALCAELLDEVAARPLLLDRELIARARAALAEPVGEGPTDEELEAAYWEGYREAPNPLAGAEASWRAGLRAVARAALAAEAVADGPAVPEGREPASVVGDPSDEEIMELMPPQMHEDFAFAARAMANEAGTDSPKAKGFMRIALNRHAVDLARAVLARFGNHFPDAKKMVGPATVPAGDVGEGPSLEEVEDLCEEHCFNVEGYESIECLQGLINDALARFGHQPAPPVEGEVGELVAWLRDAAFDLNGSDPAKSMLTRAADLLERLATAYAICERERMHQSTRAADLEIERHPAPVPVAERLPGAEDCDAEGRVWVSCKPPELATIFWELATMDQAMKWAPVDSWLPATALPLPAGEVGELVQWIHCEGVHSGYADQWLRAADLLERLAAPVPPAAGEVERAVADLRECADLLSWLPADGAEPMRRAADLLERHPVPVPVPVSERPWEREGWCDDEDRCWCMSSLDGPPPRWWLVRPEPLSDGWVLPATALPLPAGEVQP